MSESFKVLGITRDDVEAAGFKGQNLTDDQMEAIAYKMTHLNDHIMEAYWYALKYACEYLDIERKDGMLDFINDRLTAADKACAWDRSGNRVSLPDNLADKISDLCEEWCDENGYPEGYWLNTYNGPEEVFDNM